MKRFFQTSIIILIIVWTGYSQEFKFGFQSGNGYYSMSELKNFNIDIKNSLPFDTKIVSDLPDYWYFRSVSTLKFNNVSYGFVYTYQTTGSRISGKDYSGEYRFDMKLNSKAPGFYVEIDLFPQKNLLFSFYSILAAIFSNLEINEYMIVYDDEIVNDSYDYKALNYYLEPGFNLTYTIKFIGVGINTGYNLQFGDKAFYKRNDKEVELSFRSRKPIKPEWNGFRIGFSVYLFLK